MAKYNYKAKKGPQELIEGTIEASSQQEAIEILSKMGYLPTFIEEAYSVKASSYGANSLTNLKRISFRLITIFSRQLAILLKSGVSILDALNILAEQSQNISLKKIIESIYFDVKSGETFSFALLKFPKVFSPFYIAMIKNGEDSGTLIDALFRIAEYRTKQQQIMSRFYTALVYPIFMIFVGFSTIIFMFIFVMPRLMKMYADLSKLPLPTKVLLSITNNLKEKSLWIILIILFIVLFFRRYFYTENGKILLSKIKLKFPIFGKIILKKEIAIFCRTLSVLIRSGMPILKSIELTIPVLKNNLLRAELQDSYKELESGGSFGVSLKKSMIFPIFMSNLIVVGEESGKLDEALLEIANVYEQEIEEITRLFNSLFEPIIILIIGLVIGFIIIALLLPIFEVNLMI